MNEVCVNIPRLLYSKIDIDTKLLNKAVKCAKLDMIKYLNDIKKCEFDNNTFYNAIENTISF